MPKTRNVAYILLLVNVLNLAYIYMHAGTLHILGSAIYSYRGHDFPRLLPLPHEPARVLYTTEETAHYAPLGNATSDQWLSTTSAGGGYVRLGRADRTFVPTMFHELHCLWVLNRGFAKGALAVPIAHVNHCLNYVRQGVQCQPDLTLEPGAYFERRDFGREPFGGTHECKDWEGIYGFVDENFREWNGRTEWDLDYNPIGSGPAV